MKKILLLLLILFVIVPLLIGGYLGLIPGISTVFGSDKPRDLGVSTQNVQQLAEPMEATSEGQTPFSSLLKTNSGGEIEAELNSEELTAIANSSNSKFNPLSEVQVRLNDDGSMEASGYIDLSKNFGELNTAIANLPIPKTRVPFYISFTAAAIENNVSADIHKLELARVPIPVGMVEQYIPNQISLRDTQILKNSGVDINTLQVIDGKLHIKGSMPR